MKFFSKLIGKNFFLHMALALSPLMANAENIIKLLMKDKITVVKEDEDKQKSENQVNTIRQICDYLDPLNKSGQFSGSVLVAKGKDDIRFANGYGFSNYELEIYNTPTTKFRIASLTKLFTATAIMQLVEKGSLLLTDPLSKFVPDFPRAQEITIHHLLTHTSGIVNYTTLPEYEELKIKSTTPEKLIALIQNKQLDFNPGEKFSYSNSGYTILTYIIEKTTGLTYSEYLHENIFKPLAMRNTGYDDQNIILKNRASGYIKDDSNTLKNAPYRDMSLLTGAGGLYSTVEDLFKFHRALITNTILKKESIDKIFTPYQDNHGYGCTIENMGTKKFVSCIGGMSGFSSIFMHFPDNDMCIAILSNYGFADAKKIAHDLAIILLAEQKEITKPFDKKTNMKQDNFKKACQDLIDAAKRDMDYLAQLKEEDVLFTYNPGMRAIHEENAQLLEKFLDTYGWPYPSQYGHEVHYAAWLIAIHAISKPALLKKALAILEKALHEKEPVANEYAKLSDRVGLYEGRGQIYGTQFFPSPHGWYARELTDPEHVDERRAALGLTTFEENKKEVGAGEGGFMDEVLMQEDEKRYIAFLKEAGWKK